MDKQEFLIRYHTSRQYNKNFRWEKIPNNYQEGDVYQNSTRVWYNEASDTFDVIEENSEYSNIEHRDKNLKPLSYHSKSVELSKIEFTFEELKASEYWTDIKSKFNHDISHLKKQFDKFEIINDTVKSFYLSLDNVYIEYNKLTGDLYIEDGNRGFFDGHNKELIVFSSKDDSDVIENNKLVELAKTLGKTVQFLKNGIVVDNEYFETVYDYLDSKKEKDREYLKSATE